MPDPHASNAETDPPEDEAREAGQRAARGFRRLAMIVVGGIGVLALVAGGTMFGLYRSATAPVPEYEAVVEMDPIEAENETQEFESQLSVLVSEAQALPEWSSRLTERQINAWLALRLDNEFPGFRKAGLFAPRVILKDDRITMAARSTAARITGVVSLRLKPVITETDELALEIESAKIGNLVLPLEALMAQLDETPLTKVGPLRFAKTADTTALIVDFDRLDAGENQGIRLTGVDVRKGELLLRGETTTSAETP